MPYWGKGHQELLLSVGHLLLACRLLREAAGGAPVLQEELKDMEVMVRNKFGRWVIQIDQWSTSGVSVYDLREPEPNRRACKDIGLGALP